jgi:hypothetical protein
VACSQFLELLAQSSCRHPITTRDIHEPNVHNLGIAKEIVNNIRERRSAPSSEVAASYGQDPELTSSTLSDVAPWEACTDRLLLGIGGEAKLRGTASARPCYDHLHQCSGLWPSHGRHVTTHAGFERPEGLNSWLGVAWQSPMLQRKPGHGRRQICQPRRESPIPATSALVCNGVLKLSDRILGSPKILSSS